MASLVDVKVGRILGALEGQNPMVIAGADKCLSAIFIYDEDENIMASIDYSVPEHYEIVWKPGTLAVCSNLREMVCVLIGAGVL